MRMAAQRLLEQGQRLLRFVLLEEDPRNILITEQVIWLNADGLAKGAYGIVQPPQIGQGCSEVGPTDRASRTKGYRRRVAASRFLVIGWVRRLKVQAEYVVDPEVLRVTV